jgi:hypothetical protein
MSRLKGRPIFLAVAAVASLAGGLTADPGAARAYTIANAISTGCHEQLTTDALRAVRMELATAAPLPADRNEQALIDDVEFSVPADLNDLGGVTLLLGVRDNDLKGRQSNDLTELALVHGDPQLQREHCLRGSDDDEPGGSGTAVNACRDFILERIQQALGGLDATGMPDAANRTSLSVYLALRGRVDAALPTYYVRIGQAIHAVEDSFTHTFRDADGTHITVVLNWVDQANGTLVEATDGPAHENELDRCDDPDDLRHQRRLLATAAATAILRATLDPQGGNDQKMAAVAVILDQYLGYTPGCGFDSVWCQAPEHQYGSGQSLGCSVTGRGDRASIWAAAVLVGLILVKRARRSRAGGMLGGAAFLAAILMPPQVSAEPGPASTEQQTKAPTAHPPSSIAWGGHVGGAASVNHGGLATALGARLRVSKHWTFGLDGEWNPWYALNGASTIRAGAFNAYGTVIVRVPLAFERFDLRTTFNLGTSTLLIDLYGAPKGSTGIFAGFSPLGLEWALSKRLFVTLDPLGYALPAPHLGGVPFAFPQYRATVGVELYGG